MNELLQNILLASIQGSIVILAVVLLRLFLRGMPKKFLCYLWLLAGARLLMPFEIQSELSLQPDVRSWLLQLGWNDQVQALLPPLMEVLPYVYLAVAFCFTAYTVYAYFSLKCRVREAVKVPGGWECDRIDTAFILGFLRPRIYIPMGMPAYVSQHILAHERTHLEKGDHWIKMVGFLALALHWFNPLVWLAYSLLCKDIELACDERVIRFMEPEERKSYSSALLCCSSKGAHFAACPVAFGELSVRGRILAVLDYRRPSFWTSAASLACVALVALCLVTSPALEKDTIRWARELKLEDIAYMEVTSQKEDALDAWQKLEGIDMVRCLALINSASGDFFDTHGYAPEGQETIRLVMADGTEHTVANKDDKYLIIDQDVFTAHPAWLKTWQLGGVQDPNEPPRPASTSPYVRQRWAQDLRIQEIAYIDFVCEDELRPFVTVTGEEMAPWAERINAIDGDWVQTARVKGLDRDIFLSTTYVHMEDGSVYAIKAIAGADTNYFAVAGSIFEADPELFAAWPREGTGPWPADYFIENKGPLEELPREQRSQVENIAPGTPELSRPTGFAAYEWMTNLQAEDVQRIEFVNPFDMETPYQCFEGEAIGPIVKLLNHNLCYAYAPVVEAQWEGFANQEFHILMKDGTWHKISSVYTTYTVIDGVAFETISSWIQSWPETGTDPWPQNYEQIQADRDYYQEEAEQSLFSTDQFDQQRRYLDHTYDTSVEMGSKSRTYPLGRWNLCLSGHNANATSLTVVLTEGGSARSGVLKTRPQFWLEQWQDDAVSPGVGTYEKIPARTVAAMEARTIQPQQEQQWFVSWSDSYGRLSPGHYRIALAFYEEKDNRENHETICYVKFTVK